MRQNIFLLLSLFGVLSTSQTYFDPAGNQTRRLPTTIQNLDGSVTANPSWSRLHDAGWRVATSTVETIIVTNAIPPAIQQVATSYKSAMESIFGEGAETNRALDKATVAITLSLDTNVTAETGLRLSTWYEILDGYWGKGEVWTYPWGASEYIVTNKTTVWEPQ